MFGTLPIHAHDTHCDDTATGYDLGKVHTQVTHRHITSLISRLNCDPAVLAEQHNALQRIAEQGRLGIPLTLASDPRNHFQLTAGTSVRADAFSVWPEATGLAAIGDADTVRHFAAIARSEYRATGLQMTLSPMADLATEPRWPRINSTFGEDALRARALVQAYVEGFQGRHDGSARAGIRRSCGGSGRRWLQSLAADGPAARSPRLQQRNRFGLDDHPRLHPRLPGRQRTGAALRGRYALARGTSESLTAIRARITCPARPIRRQRGT